MCLLNLIALFLTISTSKRLKKDIICHCEIALVAMISITKQQKKFRLCKYKNNCMASYYMQSIITLI